VPVAHAYNPSYLAEIERITVQGQPKEKIVPETPIFKITRAKWLKW
jgi:hypothetical protein